MDSDSVSNSAQDVAAEAHQLATHADQLSQQVGAMASKVAQAGTHGDVFQPDHSSGTRPLLRNGTGRRQYLIMD